MVRRIAIENESADSASFVYTGTTLFIGENTSSDYTVTLYSSTSGIAPVWFRKCVYTEGIVSAQWDLKPEIESLVFVCSHFDQHMHGKPSRVPNGFDLVCLNQEQDRSRSIQFDMVCRPGLVWFSVVWFAFTLWDNSNQVKLFRPRTATDMHIPFDSRTMWDSTICCE